MQVISLPFGQSQVEARFPSQLPVDLILPNQVRGTTDPKQAVLTALTAPLGIDLHTWIRSLTQPPETVIAINDKTRPVPHSLLLPPLLSWLENEGIPPHQISFVIATGTHTPMPAGDFPLILPPEIIAHYRVISHDCDDPASLTMLGTTPAGTPVLIHREFASAGLKIVVGDIEPHHFMGFSGGVKTAAIGLAGRETICRNHAFITHPQARTAVYAENPMRQDVEAIGRLINVQLALNAVLNDHKEIVHVLAGTPMEVIKAGIPLVRQICQVPVSRQYDLVIASAGGHPKDINFYQAQKGLTHAAMLTRPDGRIILAAACPEGAGNRLYEQWMLGRQSHAQVLADFAAESFTIGMHKAYLVSRIAVERSFRVFSQMPLETTQRLLLERSDDLQGDIDAALAELPPGGRVAVMPQAVLSIPDIST